MVTIYTFPSLPPSSQPSHTQPSQTPPSSQVVTQPSSPSPSSCPTEDLLTKDFLSADPAKVILTEDLTLTGVTSSPPPINYYSFLSPGVDAKPRSTQLSRDSTFNKPLPAKEEIALPEVRNRVMQCQHCGQLGHSRFLCPRRDSPSVAEHHNDWRLVRFERSGLNYVYSVLALYPTLAQPKIRQSKKSKKPIDDLPTGSVSKINPAVSNGPSASSSTPIPVPSSSSSSPPQEQSVPLQSSSSMVICCTCHECTCGCHAK